jgi:hypothetical protein
MGKSLFENRVTGGVGTDSEEVRCCEERGEQEPRSFPVVIMPQDQPWMKLQGAGTGTAMGTIAVNFLLGGIPFFR